MESNRREFLKTAVKGAAFCCAAAQCGSLFAEDVPVVSDYDQYVSKVSQEITYCAYRCGKDCGWLKASFENDREKLKEFADGWSKRHDGRKLPDDEMACFGCKPVDGKPLGGIIKACDVRACAIEKGFQSCIECADLADCNKKLWSNYPQHREYVLGLQKKAKETQSPESN